MYFAIIVVHAVAAAIAVGPVLYAPWLGMQLTRNRAGGRYFLMALRATETFFNVGGWALIASGLAMLYVTKWLALRQAWLWACVGLFILDSALERWWREPAYAKLEAESNDSTQWKIAARRLQLGLLGQSVLVGAILVLMLVRPA